MAHDQLTLERIVASCPDLPIEYLDRECTEEDLLPLSEFCFSVTVFGAALGLREVDTTDIDRDNRDNEEKRFAVVQKWKESFANLATYRKFVEALLKRRKRNQAREVCRYLAGKIQEENASNVPENSQSQSQVMSLDSQPEVQSPRSMMETEEDVEKTWEKCYSKVKHNHEEAEAIVKFLSTKYGYTTSDNPESTSATVYLSYLCRFVSNEFKALDLSMMDAVLEKQPQYSRMYVQQVKRQQRKRKTGSRRVHVDVSALEKLVLVIVSFRSVHEVLELIQSLTGSVITRAQISEIMYCLATHFYSLWVTRVFPPRTHYYVYYAMVHFEEPSSPEVNSVQEMSLSPSSSSASVAADEAASSVNLTSEQEAIVKHRYRKGETVKVIAFAGTGKTFTLQALAMEYPKKKFLYCVYNKSVQQNAKNDVFKNCSNVSCHTFHALTHKFCPDGKFSEEGVQKWHVRDWLRTSLTDDDRYALAVAVFNTLDLFFASVDSEITKEAHIKKKRLIRRDTEADTRDPPFTDDEVVKQARCIWERMKSTSSEDGAVKMPHDGYLKLFQLNGGAIRDLDKKMGRKTFDFLMVDEAQDLTPAIDDILKRHKGIKVYVGDPHQSIYGFRGAINAIANVKADHTFYLTRSFRFGPEIAYVSSLLLHVMKDEKETLVGGLQRDCSIYGDQVQHSKKVAIIARKNATLYDRAIEMAGSMANFSEKKIYFTGSRMKRGTGKMEIMDIKTLLDIHDLLMEVTPLRLRTKNMKKFRSFPELKEEAAKTNDLNVLPKIKLCEKYGSNLPGMIDQILSQLCDDPDNADYVFTTAHSSKGLEFNTVSIEDDFLEGLDPGWLRLVDKNERNLIYVAATRAKNHLVMSPLMLDILNYHAKEEFFFLEQCDENAMSTDVQGQQMCINCASKPVPVSGLRLAQKKITLSTHVEEGGTVCHECSRSSVFPPLDFQSNTS